jgi:two-component system, NarL family, response regulator NreC
VQEALMGVTVVIADDYELFREGLKTLLQTDGSFSVVGTAGDGVEAVRLVRELKPDVVIMDLAMPLLNGIEATRQIAGLGAGTKVIALSMHDDLRFVSEMMTAGARGYLLKDCAFLEICDGIRTVMSGSIALSRKINDLMIRDYLQGCKPQSTLTPLNARERQVVQLLVEGKKRREIAELLHISVKTVESHRKNIMVKLNVKSIPELVRVAMKEITPLP